ncbi:MAG TPA: transglutaminase domain-containing protein [Chitinophagaceae bacterium]
MKWLLCILLVFIFSPVFPQESPEALAKQLVAPCKTELEKVTAIFKWITENISYKVYSTDKMHVTSAFSLKSSANEGEETDDGPLKPLNERVAETVLQKREAVCDGYSRLFTTLCDYAGIRSEVIIGYAKVGWNKPTRRFGVNHYWNAVMIDGVWHLLDATWASGFLSMAGDEFIRKYDENYFLTPPEIFIQDHYPDDARWTLLPDSKIPQEFYRSPFKQKSFVKYHFTSFYPAAGIIETFVGDTIRLSLETDSKESGRNVSPDLLIDSAIFSYSPSWIFLRPDLSDKPSLQNRYNYVYTVASPDVAWLYLLYNDDLVLRYRINVKKKKT